MHFSNLYYLLYIKSQVIIGLVLFRDLEFIFIFHLAIPKDDLGAVWFTYRTFANVAYPDKHEIPSMLKQTDYVTSQPVSWSGRRLERPDRLFQEFISQNSTALSFVMYALVYKHQTKCCKSYKIYPKQVFIVDVLIFEL